jgi:hypothetical protein
MSMVATITPAVAGGSRTRYLVAVALHTLSAGAVAAALGALLGRAGGMLGAPWGAAGASSVALVAVAYAGRDLLGLPLPLPQRRTQVPEWWRTFFSLRAVAVLYGVGLGPGFLTFLGFGTFVAVAAGAVAGGDPLGGAALCAPFGLVRGVSVLIGARAPERAVARLEQLASGRVPRTVNGAALAAVAVVVAAGA